MRVRRRRSRGRRARARAHAPRVSRALYVRVLTILYLYGICIDLLNIPDTRYARGLAGARCGLRSRAIAIVAIARHSRERILRVVYG